MKKYLLLILPFILLSCFAKKEVKSNSNKPSSSPLAANNDCLTPYGTWKMIEKPTLSPKMKDQKLPTIYKTYTINEATLKQYMLQINKSKQKEITLPTHHGCSTFTLSNSGTMSPELAAQFPEILSFQGNNIADGKETIRLDYDGSSLRASITNTDGTYILDPFETKEGKYYLLFDKQHSGIPQVPYEK